MKNNKIVKAIYHYVTQFHMHIYTQLHVRSSDPNAKKPPQLYMYLFS
jgi:hypothetical protein